VTRTQRLTENRETKPAAGAAESGPRTDGAGRGNEGDEEGGVGSGAGAMDAEKGERAGGGGEIGAGAARSGAGTGVGEAGAVPLEWLAEAQRCHVRISRRGGRAGAGRGVAS
jgi:hypothetical protein